jgi:hypothetical protein
VAIEIVHDFPGGEWRRVQRPEGYSANAGERSSDLQDGKCSVEL